METLTLQQIKDNKKIEWFIMQHHNNCTICGKEFDKNDKSYFGHQYDGAFAYTCETCSMNLQDAILYTNNPKKCYNVPSSDEKLWRYMDLAKFLSLLNSSSLYFTRLDHFVDPYEGALGVLENEEAWVKNEKERLKQGLAIKNKLTNLSFSEGELEIEANQHLAEYREKLKNWRTSNYISCWHKSDYESEAMWQLYAKGSKQGIAIQTTFERLYRSLPDELQFDCGLVNYVDYNEYNNGNSDKKFSLFEAPWYKRNSFDHEKEFRIIVEDDRKLAFRDFDKSIKVNLNLLIETVFISPQADGWFVELVRDVIMKYGYHLNVLQSDLNKLPFY